MTTPEENNNGLVPIGSSELVRRMDHRLELLGRLIEEIQAKDSSGTGSEVAVSMATEAQEFLEGSRPGEEHEFEIAPGVKMRLCWIPPGEFVMGSPVTEAERSNNEDQVRVTLTNGYWIGKYQVTQAQWQAVMGSNPSYFTGADLPVARVSWNNAQEFLQKVNAYLSKEEGNRIELPTEAQWEYAARAGEAGPYSGGSIDEVAWYWENSGKTTHVVGTKRPNSWGLHDMSGNVLEWCSDWYGRTLSGGLDPKGPASGSLKVFRGGSWNGNASYCRIAFRVASDPTDSFFPFGFRVVLQKNCLSI